MNKFKGLVDRMRGRPDLRDGRSRKVVLVPHCVLNQNARSAGAAERPAAVVELVTGLLERDIGILQMPCPEICAFGLDRGPIRIETEMRTPENREISRRLALELIKQIRTYRDCGVQVTGVLGKNGSPTCGVEETWNNGVCPGTGAFIEELKAELKQQSIDIQIAGMRDSEPEAALAVVDRWLKK